MKKEKWRTLAIASALLLIGSGAAQAQVKVRGSVFGGGEKANVTGTDTVRIHGSENDTVLGNVYGGGLQGQVSVNTVVEVSGGVIGTPGKTQNGTQYGIPVIPVANGGRVFGGGEGTTSNREHGWVAGNTFVTISGTAKVLRNVYGGGELASVGSGNLSDKNSGVTTVTIKGGVVGPLDGTGTNGYVFAGGRGYNDDNDAYWNFGNVDSASLVMTSGTIYGSLFGGAEDGHVIGDATVSFSGGTLGTTGKTSWDGNIFGGGRNYEGKENTSGRVGGNIHVNVSGTTGLIMGNVFGGGRYSSVGIKRTSETDQTIVMQNGDDHGNIFVTIDGNTIGRSDIDTVTSGSVIGGCRGDVGHLQGDLNNPALGHAKNTYITINGGHIYANVLGGAAYGTLQNDAHITMNGGEIGVVTQSPITGNDTVTSGNVYGGGRGYVDLDHANGIENGLYGIVLGDTYVNINGGLVHNNVYGGGKNGTIGTYVINESNITATKGTTHVTVMGGTIGSSVHDGMNGYVFGGGQGLGNDPNDHYKYVAAVVNTEVRIDSAALVNASVFGGGAEGHVWDGTLVDIRGGQIGTTGVGINEGNVYGGGGNLTETNYTAGRVGGNTHVIVRDSAMIFNNVYGGGYAGLVGVDLDGHPYTSDPDDHGNTLVEIRNGIIGADENGVIKGEGNVFGGGKGSIDGIEYGFVRNAEVQVSGSHIYGNVYGGGEMASVGVLASVGGNTVTVSNETYGLAKVVVSGGKVGVEQVSQGRIKGNVFGGGYGVLGTSYDRVLGNADSTRVEVSGTAYIVNSVYGGAENGHVEGNTSVAISGGTIGRMLTLDERKYKANGDHVFVFTGNVYGGGRGSEPISTNPSVFSPTAGRVYGNTNVNVSGGTIRHNVYGGGALASVGDFTIAGDTVSSYTSGGKATVTISGGTIGPKLDDLIKDANGDDLTQVMIDSAFLYLGNNEGNVYGSIRGEPGLDYNTIGFVKETVVTISDNAQIVGSVFGGAENGAVFANTEVNINGGTIGGAPLHEGQDYTIPEGLYANQTVNLADNDSEIAEDEYGVGREVLRGSVFGGGRGSDTYNGLYNYTAGRVYGNTEVNVAGGKIYHNVYGGGTIASVGRFKYDASVTDSIVGVVSGGNTVVVVSGGQIGTDGFNNGEVYGGGLGLVAKPGDMLTRMAYVDSTQVTIQTGADIRRNVYGGSANGSVQNVARVTMTGGTVGTSTSAGWHGNVYGGGGGTSRYTENGKQRLSITAGRVYGDTYVDIEGGLVCQNVYGGGAIASVGTYNHHSVTQPYLGRGHTTVTITGGTIGIDGDENGMVFGSGRGHLAAAGEFLDSLTYAAYSTVNIGKLKSATTPGNDPDTIGSAWVKGSVFGGGENGHSYLESVVNVYKGTIGCTTQEYVNSDQPWKENVFRFRGNVYGAGYGADMYDSDNDGIVDSYNPMSGITQGNTKVNIYGGYISHNVYGGGAMASVGVFTIIDTLDNPQTESALSWPYKFNYLSIPDANGTLVPTGKAEVTIKGGHIGTYVENDLFALSTSGNVFGSSRGKAGNRYKFVPFGNAKETKVHVNYTNNPANAPGQGNLIVNSVYGGGENGHVYDSARVIIDNGFIGGSVMGGGKGTDLYSDTLWITADNGATHTVKQDTLVHSITAGKVFGNTEVIINGGVIQHNVFGGGEYASVGKGNYKGYGENGPASDTTDSGHCVVRINGGTIGTNGYLDDYGISNGSVYGSSKGITFPVIQAKPRYNYSHDFFMGYSNKTYVIIGESVVATPNDDSPCIKGSVFGGGENGHVRFNTEVTVNDANIGVTYDPNDGPITANKWKLRGNVYGAGRGIDMISGTTDLCYSAGSVTDSTHVTINGGLIHRHVYGGGSLATVGPPRGYTGNSICIVDILGGTIGDPTSVTYEYGGDVYGSSRGEIAAIGNQQDTLAYAYETRVNIGKKTGNVLSGNALVHGSVYGSGENGHVTTNATVNIYSGHIGDVNTQIANEYCGNVYGGGSGTDKYDSNNDNTPDAYNPLAGIVKGNTTINLEGGYVMRNVYGGGEMASVGTIDNTGANDTTLVANKHTDPTSQLALSWPYRFVYQDGTGTATINMTGGRVGVTGKYYGEGDLEVDNGDVYGGSKGVALPRYVEAHLANVNKSIINIDFTTTISSNAPLSYMTNTTASCIAGAVYGGGESGHVIDSTSINLTNGLIGHAIYGGGKGKDKYNGEYSLTAGKVYGNTHVNINGGHVVRSVFGGGNLASVGKGNYNGDTYRTDYGEYSTDDDDLAAAANSGHTYLNIFGGTLGALYPDQPDTVFKDNVPYGSVFGGCRGKVVKTATTITDDRFGYVNNTHVTIGKNTTAIGPTIYGSVFGGAQDGHVRHNTDVVVNSGTIGFAYDASTAQGLVGSASVDNENWTERGNVYGGGSGIDHWTVSGSSYPQYCPIAGSVLGKTNVTVNGGTIHRNVYGGGNLASVGPASVGSTDCPIDLAGATVNINHNVGHSGTTYGGHVFGGSRGKPNPTANPTQQFVDYGFVAYTEVNINDGASIPNAVFGGGENGMVGVHNAQAPNVHNTKVNIYGGTVEHTVYGGGEGVFGETGYEWDTVAGYIMGNTEVNLLAGTVNNVFGGGRNAIIGNGATVNVGLANMTVGGTTYDGTTFKGYVYGANNHHGTPLGDINVNIYKTAHTTDNTYPAENITTTAQLHDLPTDDANFAIKAVYGGGNESSYTPGAFLYHRAAAAHNTTVHVYNCDNTIKEVYGGANAADIGTSSVNADSYVIIEGGRIHNVYGGGKGNNSLNFAANIYGTANTEIQGGLIDAVYGGGNQMGSILATNLIINDQTSTTECDILLDSIFGGSNLAPINGDIVTTIACSDRIYDNIYGGANKANITGNVTLNILGSTITNVFGGSKGTTSTPANIDGNVTLNLYGGTITNAFGGSDINGNITGVVTVNVLDTVKNCALDLTNVYGGSSIAELQADEDANGNVISSPVVNIVHGTVKGNVFGGGRGNNTGNTAAIKSSNPVVNIGYDSNNPIMSNTSLNNALSHLPTGLTVSTLTDTVKGNVYGGGALAEVHGDPTVNVNHGVVGVITYDKKHGNTSAVLDTIIHAPNSGMVFGGGKGRDTNVSSDHNIAKVTGDTRVNIKGGQVLYSVYGGGELASVSDSAFVTVTGGQVGPAPKVGTEGGKTYNIPIGLNGTDGYVFGGGKGVGDDPISSTNPYGAYYRYADVKNTLVTVNIPTDADTTVNRIWGSIFGGAEDGHVTNNANVRYVSGMMGTKGTTSYDGNIFGGGRNYSKKNYTAGRVGGNIKVEMSGGQLLGSIFGGGRLALTGINRNGQIQSGSTYGNVKVIVKGGQVGNQKLIESWTASSMGDVYGGGKGSMTGILGHDPASALLISITKNTEVIVKDSIASDGTTVVSSPIIYGSVFGGGEVANVGEYSWTQDPDGSIHHINLAGQGLAKVTVSGGRIGPDKMRMSYDPDENTDLGHVFGGGEGIVADPDSYAAVNTVPFGDISLLNVMATVGRTEVTVTGDAWVKGSVYGGAENGHVLGNASVLVAGGQIGSGEMPAGTAERKYTETEFETATDLADCPHWPFGTPDGQGHTHYYSYDPHLVQEGKYPSDGHTWFGNVFGGGSGYYPYIKNGESQWNPYSGWVKGSSKVEITGGHILTNVYGGSEVVDVAGDSTIVVMSGGTVGVPRNATHIAELPLTGYLFGAGKGDPRSYFNTWTNVQDVRVEVSGGWIYGSVMGGGEEGHVHNNVKLTVKGNTGSNADAIAGNATKIGTFGYTSFDGNVFGAGRGFTGEALTAGVVGGNVTVHIKGGQMLGSVFGGGRLASVGTEFANPTIEDPSNPSQMVPNPHYGHMVAGDDHGVVTVNISGGIIGNDYESVTHHFDYTEGGNVFGGGMGRILNLDGTNNPIWPDLDRVKRTTVNVSGTAVIMGSVYGGGEHGTVEQNAVINVMGGTIWRDVYGAGHGSDDVTHIGKLARFTDDPSATFGIIVDTVQVTPMEWAGRVKGNTNINVSGGWIKKCVYGGGELASVGSIEFDQTVKHEAPHPFNISWPYKFVYKTGTGTATVNVTGGRIGITGKDYMGPWNAIGGDPIGYDSNGTAYTLSDDEIDEQREDNGDLYGGGKGIAADRYEEGLCANVDTTKVIINITNTSATPANYKDLTLLYDCVTGAVYGGGENGHVNTNAYTTLNNGLIGHAIYGGGKGKGKYSAQVLNPTTGNYTNQKIYSVTAGKVYGNTYININGGHVLRSVFGGGNLGSVGIGNYAGGYDDYNTFGYGEVVSNATQWADTTNSGHTYVNILGGTIGMLPLDPTKPESVFKDNIPYGSVFGGCRGAATPDVTPAEVAHLFESRPDVFLSYVNHTHVKIGDDTHSPRLYGSVYGGAQDGHVRWNSNVVVNNGVIGAEYGVDNVGSNDLTSVYWTDRGNVFGGGSGIGTYKDDGGTEHNSSVAGSVTQKAHVIVNGGTIYRNVYGGGNMATVGPPRDRDASTGVALIDHDCPIDSTCVTVDLNAGATIGTNADYGGNVYGASRGKANPDSDPVQQYKNFALCSYTVVNINGANILKNVYGGGENGQVGVAGGDTLCHTTTVNLNSGLIGTSTANAHVFGGGQGVWGETGYTNDTLSGRVMGTATVNINGGEVTGNVFGGGQLGITYGETYANISGGIVHNHVFGGAWGKIDQIHVYGIRMTNMRSGLVKGNVYGGSYNGDDALEPHPEAFANNNTTETVSLVNYSGGTAMKHVFGAGDHGKSYGSTYVLVGLNAIMNAPPHTATTGSTDPYNQAYYANHGDLIINYDVWAGADFGESNTGTFGTNSITGRSDVYVDGYGYDTENTVSQGDDRFMLLYRSIFGCGTLNDGGRQGKQIMIRNYGYAIDNTGTTDPEHYIDATRRLVSVQYADSLIIESSHIRLQGRGIVNQNIATEEYAIYNIFDKVRVINGSSLFVDKPVNNIGNLYSNRSSNLANHAYPTTPVYTEVNYDGLDATDNKIRINHGGYLTVSITSVDAHGATTTLYGALRGFFHLMTDGVYNAFAYARPKQSNEAGNIISNSQLSHAYNEDGGFVSYRPEVNIYDAIGTLIEEGGSIQMRYENHTPDQRGDIYFRVWRFSEQAASVLEVVLHAISQPNNPNGFTYYTGTLTLPPRVNDNSIYRVKSNNGVAQINYGSEIALMNAGYQEEGSNWMYYDNNSSSFVMNQSENASALEEGQVFMAQHPNNVFGLVAIPTGGLMATPSQDNQTLLICNESNSGVVDNVWHNTLTTAAPQVKFVLTHNNHITGNYSWDPIAITMEQVDGENVTDVVDVYVRIVTTTSIDQPNEVNTYAMMNHGGGTGDNYDVYRAKILLPAYQLIAGADTSAWTLKSVEWLPNDTVPALNGDVFNPNTLVAGEPYAYCSPYPDSLTRNFVGMTVRPTANVDNVVGWWNDYTQVAEVDLGEKKMVNGVNPIPSGGIYLGSTRGENPISFEFDLHYDSKQNVGLAGNAEMGTVKVTMHFTNYETAEGKDVEFYVQVSRRGKGKGFYIDGVNGQFIYSGRYPDAAQPSFAGIMYFADDYEPVDSIYIVNKVTVNPPVHLDWSTPYDEIRFFRYNGGHPLHRDEPEHNDKFFSEYLDTYLHPNTALPVRTNPAYKGLLVDVMSTMNIRSASVDGAYTLPECVGQPRTPSNNLINPTFTQLEDHVISDAPMFQIRQDATLTIDGANDHISILRNNYNKSSNGGAANLETGATLMMNQQTYIDNNYVQDGVSEEHHGGGAYLEGTATLVVSDDVMINTNKHVSADRTDPDIISENVYLNDYVTMISVGTGDGADTYGALNNTSRIGVTKTAWNGVEYMPVVYTEYRPHGDNLISDSHYHDGQIVFDQDMHYGLYPYPMRKANDDPFYQHKLYWVKTWTDVVTSQPDDFEADNINTPEKLAWAISIANGLNTITSPNPQQGFIVTADIDMGRYIWEPIGTYAAPYYGSFEGNGHLVSGIHSPFSMDSKGMFGYTTTGAEISNLQAEVNFDQGDVTYLGGLVGSMGNGTLSNCSSSGYLSTDKDGAYIGGLVGNSSNADVLIHSCYAIDTLCSTNASAKIGGLVGVNEGDLLNAYSRPTIGTDNAAAVGGLVGDNTGIVENCYAEIGDLTIPAFAVKNESPSSGRGVIQHCYTNSIGNAYVTNPVTGSTLTAHGTYGLVKERKEIGYMYADNAITLANGGYNAYVPENVSYIDHHTIVWNGMLSALNQWVRTMNTSGSTYYDANQPFTSWFRPTTKFINDDLPVLGFPKDNAMATLDANPVNLRYSAAAFDGNHASVSGHNGLDQLLSLYREETASIFLYDNATGVAEVPGEHVKVFVNEDATLLQGANPADFTNTTVGITFDNSSRSAAGYYWGNSVTLEYDWHFLGTPLSNAQIGITYNDEPSALYSAINLTEMEDSYFPNGLQPIGQQPRWDLYTYYEPEYHWINLKRRGDNHYHVDRPYHRIDYRSWQDGLGMLQNETIYVPGKGYMMAIEDDSYMSQTGTLNKGPVKLIVSHQEPAYASYAVGCNLLGNPYQAYLDLNAFAAANTNAEATVNKFYAYDADLGVYAPYIEGASVNPCIPSQYIHPHQGFFALYEPTDGNSELSEVTFTPDMATTQNEDNSYYRQDKVNYPVVNIFAENEGGSRDLAIVELMRPELGGVGKTMNFNSSSFKLYTRLEGENFGLLFTPKETKRIPLFFKTDADGKYSLKWNTFNGNFHSLILVDNITGQNYDMLTHDHYDFEALATDFAARFYIVFSVTAVDEYTVEGEDDEFAFFDGNDWVVEGEGELQLIDVTGRVIHSETMHGSLNRVHFQDLATGVYVFHLVKDGEITKVQKIVIRK